MRTWNRTEEVLPPEGQEVVILNGPHEQTLVFERGLWWFPDRSMYVYFTPKLWRPLDATEPKYEILPSGGSVDVPLRRIDG